MRFTEVLAVVCLAALPAVASCAGTAAEPPAPASDDPAAASGSARAGDGGSAARGPGPGPNPGPSPGTPSPDAGASGPGGGSADPDARPAAAADRPAAGDVPGATAAPDAFFGVSRCSAANVLFCEDFESGAIDRAKWTTTLQKATVGVDTMRAARGRYALHVQVSDITAEFGSRGQITTRRTFPVAGSRLFVRAFLYIDVTSERHYTLLSAKGVEPLPTGGSLGYSVNLVPYPMRTGRPNIYRYLWSHGTPEPGEKYATERATLGRWVCWEWELRGTNNELYFQADDKPVPSFTVTAAMGWTAPATAQLVFGFHNSHPEPLHPEGFNVWIDEIAVANERIGCAN